MYFEKFCKTCPEESHCCIFNHDKGFTFVGISDAKKIKEYTGKEFREFLNYSPLPSNLKKDLKDYDPAMEGAMRLKQVDAKRRILRLKKQDNGRCIFLTSKGKCGIYPVRPKICRIYPFWAFRLLDGSLKVVEHDAEPSCPIVLSIRKKGKSIENSLSQSQLDSIKVTFAEIEAEAIEYKKGILAFSKGL